ILPEALQTNCAKCTEKQRTVAYRTIKRLKKEYPKIWDQLQAIWDPNDVYVKKFEDTFESQKPSAAPVAAQSPFLANRFGENEESNASSPPSPPSSTTTRTTTITTTTKSTNKPTSSILLTRPQQAPSYTTVGANLQSTVSFGTNLVGGIVRSLGRVVESGTKLANMVISAVIRP
ncbi:OS-D domain containing protein, partial [Asbolus verrucosus]